MSSITNVQEAVGVLVQAAQMAQQKGIYTLQEAGYISDAINYLYPPESAKEDNSGDSPEQEKETPQNGAEQAERKTIEM